MFAELRQHPSVSVVRGHREIFSLTNLTFCPIMGVISFPYAASGLAHRRRLLFCVQHPLEFVVVIDRVFLRLTLLIPLLCVPLSLCIAHTSRMAYRRDTEVAWGGHVCATSPAHCSAIARAIPGNVLARMVCRSLLCLGRAYQSGIDLPLFSFILGGGFTVSV